MFIIAKYLNYFQYGCGKLIFRISCFGEVVIP